MGWARILSAELSVELKTFRVFWLYMNKKTSNQALCFLFSGWVEGVLGFCVQW